jgi:hypothetical protein
MSRCRNTEGASLVRHTKASTRGDATEVIVKVNETLLPQLRELPGFAGYYLIDGGGVLNSFGLFDSSDQADGSTEYVLARNTRIASASSSGASSATWCPLSIGTPPRMSASQSRQTETGSP